MDNKNNYSDSSGYDTERVDEMMVLEINFGVGKVDEVTVHFGDDPSVLAEQFARKHNLKSTVVPAISKHISEAILEFTESNTEMRPQSPSLDATNENENIRSDEYLKLQGNQRLPPKDLPASKVETSSPPTVTISKETLDQFHSQDTHTKYSNTDNHNTDIYNYEISSEQDGTLASSVDIALEYMIEKKSGYFASNVNDSEGNASRGYQMVHSNRVENDKLKKNENSANNKEDNYNNNFDNDNADAYDDLNRTSQSQNAREMTYNRIKRDWNQKGVNSSIDLSKTINKTSKILNSSKVSTSLNMGKTFDKTPLFTKITGKTANERLYNSAKLITAKKQYNQQKAIDDVKRELESSKYKINNVSRMLAENKQPHDDYEDIGHRLHDEGISEKLRREKLHAEKANDGPLEEWSCSRCGMFHKLPSINVFSKNNNLECPNCKWLQSAAIPHQPVNIAMELGSIDPKEVLSKRWQGNMDGNIDLHEYLFANQKLQAKKMNNLRSQWADIDLRLPFKPVIPESSELILKQKMEEKASIASSLKQKVKNDRPGDQDLEPGEYFHIPAAERLFRYKIKSNPAPRKKIELSGFYEQEMHDAPKRSSSEVDMLTSRLTYEYKDKETRRQQAVVEVYTNDPKTKQPYFKPIVIPAPSKEGHGISTIIGMDSQEQDSKKRDVFTELLQDSDIKIRNRILEQQRYYEALEEKMAKERATALPQSEQILKDATDRSIEEMYRLLIATSTLNSNDANIDKAEMICKMSTDIPNWELQVLDLNNVNIDVMIPEIKALVVEVRNEKLKKYEKLSNEITSSTSSQSSSVIIDFKEFGILVRKCLKKRNGPGRTYVYAPKKRPHVTLELLQNELQEETHQPVIDKVSAVIAKERYVKKSVPGASYARPIEEVLLKEGKKVQEKIAIARKQKEEQELKNLNFKPHIYKPPKSVVPRYRGLPVYEIDGKASSNTATTIEKTVEVKKTLRGGVKKTVDKKPSPAKSLSTTPKTTPRQAQLSTSEKLLSAVWMSLSGQDTNEGNENKKDSNVPPPPSSASNPPQPPKSIDLVNDHSSLDDKITNRKVKGKKKVEE